MNTMDNTIPTPSTPAVTPSALSTITATAVPPPLKREVRAHRGRSTLIFTVLVALLVAAMMINGVYSMPDGSFSLLSLYTMAASVLLVGIWKVLVWCLDKTKNTAMATDLARVNEVYAQGAMSTGAFGRVVIPFEEVISFVETRNWIALYSKTGEIVWLASDLTTAQAQHLFSLFATYLPQTVFIRKSPLLPCKPFETDAPEPFSFSAPIETLPAKWSAKGATSFAFAALLKRGVSLFILMSTVLANVLCDGFGFFSHNPFAGRLLLMTAGILVCAGLGWLLVAWEQTTATNEKNKNEVCLHLLSDGVRIQDGAEFTVLPSDKICARRDKNGAVNLLLGNRVLTVSFPVFSGSTAARDIFKL